MTAKLMKTTEQKAGDGSFCRNRREFLLKGSGAVAATFLLTIPGIGLVEAAGVKYAKKKIGRISQLKTDTPVLFSYPFRDFYSQNIVVKLGVRAAGGVGPQQDIVAFNTLCTHMGGPLGDKYNAEHKVLGACPLHLTTFDLRRRGMVVAGHATENLPQIVLEVKRDDIYAVGIIGLVYGKHDNLTSA